MPDHTTPRRSQPARSAGAGFLLLLLLLGVTLLASHPATHTRDDLLTLAGWWLVAFPVLILTAPVMARGKPRPVKGESYRARHYRALGCGVGDRRHDTYTPGSAR